MAWNNTAVTTAGNALLQRVLAGEQLHLDYAAGGSGTVDAASLMAQTTLINQQQMINIVSLSKVVNGQKINMQILNAGLKTGYTMQQIGIWAHIGTEEPLLFAILQDEKGIDIPSEYEVGDFALNFYAVIDFSNQSEFQITVDPSALVTHATLLEEMSKKANSQHVHGSSDITDIESELSANSKKLITSGGVFAAVRGYGLGGSPTQIIKSLKELDSVTDIGWYQVIAPDSQLSSVFFNYATLFVVNRVDAVWQQLYFVETNCSAVRCKDTHGNWSIWLWENPPMQEGIAYPTTEKIDNKIVYITYINFGMLPNAASKMIDVPQFSSVDGFVDCYGIIHEDGEANNYTLSSSELITKITLTSNSVKIKTTTDLSNHSARLIVKFTKISE